MIIIGKMFQVTTLLIFTILTGQMILTKAAVDTQLNYTQDIDKADSHLLCSRSTYISKKLFCNHSTPILIKGNCATFDEKTKVLSIFQCPYFQYDCYNITRYHDGNMFDYVIQLPRNLSQLNDYMCGPMNRKGLVCSECADGFGPAVTSFQYKCANCSETKHAVPLFLFLEFVLQTFFLRHLLSVSNQSNLSSNTLFYHVCTDHCGYV